MSLLYLKIDETTLHMTLTDFGLSQVMSGTMAIGTKTMMAETPGFQSPEQLKAQNIGPGCDVYTFGCVVVILFTERVLWPGLTPYQIMVKITVENEKPDTNDLTPNVYKLCGECVSDISNRPLIMTIHQELLQICGKIN